MNLYEVELRNKNLFNWSQENSVLWKKVLLVYLSDFWLMTFFLGMWEIYTWGDYMFEEFDDDYEPLDAL